jgi:hypothetical protein
MNLFIYFIFTIILLNLKNAVQNTKINIKNIT